MKRWSREWGGSSLKPFTQSSIPGLTRPAWPAASPGLGWAQLDAADHSPSDKLRKNLNFCRKRFYDDFIKHI